MTTGGSSITNAAAKLYLTLEMNKECTNSFPVRSRHVCPEFMVTFHNFIPEIAEKLSNLCRTAF
jgi:hypothetical protein